MKVYIGAGNGTDAIVDINSYGKMKIVELDYTEAGWEEWEREDSVAKNISDYIPLLNAYLSGNLENSIVTEYDPANNTFKFVGNGGKYGNYIDGTEHISRGGSQWKARDWKQEDGVYQYDLNRIEIYDEGVMVHWIEPSEDVYTYNTPILAPNGRTYTRGALLNDLSAFGARGYAYTVDYDIDIEVKTMKILIYTGVN